MILSRRHGKECMHKWLLRGGTAAAGGWYCVLMLQPGYLTKAEVVSAGIIGIVMALLIFLMTIEGR